MWHRLLVWILACSLATSTFAQSTAASWHATKGACQPHAKLVVYINGMMNPDPMQVALDTDDLREKLDRAGIYSDDVQFLYNPSNGNIDEDIVEAAKQKAGEQARNALELSAALQVIRLQIAGLSAVGAGAEAERLTQLIARMSTVAYDLLQDPEGVRLLDAFEREIQTTLNASNKVVLVAHSQGNFIANALHTRIVAASPDWIVKGLSVVNIATPSRYTPSGLYLTSSADVVMVDMPAAPPSNMTVMPGVSLALHSLGHGFVEIYLSESPNLLAFGTALQRTLSLISEALDQGKDEVPRCCNGSTAPPAPDPSNPNRTTLHYLLRASDSPGVAVTGSKPMNALVMGQLANEPWWTVNGTGISDADGIDIIWRMPESLEFKPRVYRTTDTPSWVMFNEPTERLGQVFRHLGDGSSVQVDVKTSRMVCIDYNYGSNGVMNLDRTDAASAVVWLEVTGSANWSLASRSRLDCSAAGPSVCNLALQPSYDNLDIGFGFGPLSAPVRVTPSTVRF